MSNFISGISALGGEAKIVLSAIFSNSLFTGFVVGVIITLILIGFVLSEDPKHVPIMLKHSCPEGFKKITTKDHQSVCVLSYSTYEKIYLRVRILFFSALLTFSLMVIVILVTN